MNVLTCFLLMTGDLTGLMGETDSLVAGETGLQQHRIKIQSNFMHHPVLKRNQEKNTATFSYSVVLMRELLADKMISSAVSQ